MPHDSSLKGYWDHANFRLVDALNAEMWTRSPQLQREIQSPHDLIGTGKVGPQQAMLEPDAALPITTDTVLPWVPDIVGKDADGDRAVIIFGAAYAGFIREYSSRRACLGLSDYAKAATNDNEANWTVFQRLFLNNVVARDAVSDGDYYGKLESLLISAGISANRIILSDLCPNSIVKRGPAPIIVARTTANSPPKTERPSFASMWSIQLLRVGRGDASPKAGQSALLPSDTLPNMVCCVSSEATMRKYTAMGSSGCCLHKT